MEEQTGESYHQSTHGCKAKNLDGKSNNLGSHTNKQQLIQKIMEIFNEQYRSVLWRDHHIQFGDVPAEQYYLGINNFLKNDARLEDGVNVGQTFPLPPATIPAMIAATAATTTAVATVNTNMNTNNDDDAPAGDSRNGSGDIVELDDSESEEKEIKEEQKSDDELLTEEMSQPLGVVDWEKRVKELLTGEMGQPLGVMKGKKCVEKLSMGEKVRATSADAPLHCTHPGEFQENSLLNSRA
ncbi:MAG: hypothetical protein M1830_008386 [Pleopsidium flavum]|nr:MAG: hypothetical protein M1830_008386 [Pleopsidium flavum]